MPRQTPDQYQSSASTFARDVACSKTKVCCTEVSKCKTLEFESTPPTPVADRKCGSVKKCSSGQVELKKPTAKTDRICGVSKKDFKFGKKIEKYTIAVDGVYKLTAAGAVGGSFSSSWKRGGLGAVVNAEFSLKKGQVWTGGG